MLLVLLAVLCSLQPCFLRPCVSDSLFLARVAYYDSVKPHFKGLFGDHLMK